MDAAIGCQQQPSRGCWPSGFHLSQGEQGPSGKQQHGGRHQQVTAQQQLAYMNPDADQIKARQATRRRQWLQRQLKAVAGGVRTQRRR
jgi:hypothetical protein